MLKEYPHNVNQIEINILSREKVKSTLNLMQEIKPNIGGIRSKLLYKALLNSSFKDERMLFITALQNSEVIGFQLVIMNRFAWRVNFISKHPIVLVLTAFARIKKLIGNKIAQDTTINIPSFENVKINLPSKSYEWTDSSFSIAKILYIGTKNNKRGTGLATDISNYTFKLLHEKGVKRIDAQILFDNIASIKLHAKLGFNLFLHGNAIFATKFI